MSAGRHAAPPTSPSDEAPPMKPVLFVTGHAPPERVAPFALLAAREDVRFALVGGRALHALPGAAAPQLPHLRVRQRDVLALAASGEYRAVIASTGGRVALPAAYIGARRAGVPFLLWASIWAHPRSLAGIAGYLPLRHLYRHADALVTYGPHVSAYLLRKGARNVHVASQAVDGAFWRAPVAQADVMAERRAAFQALFVGRWSPEKGGATLLEAWRQNALASTAAALVLVGEGAPSGDGVVAVGPQPAARLRNFYAASDVVVIPSVATRTVRETWSLVANEAMNQGKPIIATDAVGAVAGGLIRHERNGLVVPAGDAHALAAALRRLHDDRELRMRLGDAARADVAAYTFTAWVDGFAGALASVGVGRGDPDAAVAGPAAPAATFGAGHRPGGPKVSR